MKPYTTGIIIMSLFVVCIGCSKETKRQTSESGNVPGLIGNWEWKSSKAGWGGTIIPGPDTAITLSFFSDYSYTIRLNNQTKYAGNFSAITSPVPDSYTTISFPTNLEVANLRL